MQILSRPDPPSLWVVIDEAVLRRPVGGAAVMRAQLDRLIDATGKPNITLQVLPFTAGAHPVWLATAPGYGDPGFVALTCDDGTVGG